MALRLPILIFLSLLLARPAAFSAQPLQSNPKIGLVLSGGGAKGLAQIGALQVIDSLGIKVDYISGTSMGAIIGSMYALGYTVEEIEKYLDAVDWDALLSNAVPRNRLSYFDRKAESRYLVSFPIEDGKVRLPSGLNYSQYILKQLSYLTQKSNQYESFSQYPIPFLCVATNLENGHLRIFEDGRLMDALRASSAFPSLFTPYELNGNLYVDGGVINNYPVQQLLDRGMDFIIGIDVQDFLYEKDDLNSVVRVLEQTSSFIKAEEYLKQVEQTDILIKPKIVGANITSFDRFEEMVEAGRKAAREMIPQLQLLALMDTASQLKRETYHPLPLEDFMVDSIILIGNENSSDDFILSKLRLKDRKGCTIDRLERGIDQLYGSRYFETVDYELVPSDTGQGYRLRLKVKENTSLAQFRVGLHYDDDFKTALLVNYTKRNLLFKNSRFSFDFAVGDNPRTNLSYFVDRGFVPTLGFKFRANRFETRLYNDAKPVVQLNYFEYSADFFIQSTIYDALALGGGIQFEGIDLSQELDLIGYTDTYRNYINYYGFIDFDSFNSANYPTVGFKFSTRLRLIARQEKLERFFEPSSVLDLNISQAFSVGKRVSVVGSLLGATTIGPDLDYPYSIFLGSMGRNYINYIYPFIGYRFMELIGRNALVARADVHYQFVKKHYIVLRGNVGSREPTFDELLSPVVLLDGYSLGYSYDSPLGPLEINVTGSTNHSRISTYIALGFWF